MTAGLSLGEYSALVASGAMKFEEAVALVQKKRKIYVRSSSGRERRNVCDNRS